MYVYINLVWIADIMDDPKYFPVVVIAWWCTFRLSIGISVYHRSDYIDSSFVSRRIERRTWYHLHLRILK